MMYCYKDPESGAPALVMDNVFDLEQLEKMKEEVIKNVAPQTGEHLEEGKLSQTNSIRISTVRWFMDPGFESTLRQAVDIANHVAGWKYDIVESEMLQFTEYNVDGHYSWHTDGQGDHLSARTWAQEEKPKTLIKTKQPKLLGTVRKLSVSVILNDDYEGGKMEFAEIDTKGKIKTYCVEPKVGTVIIFPSYTHHRVSPVTKGTRYSVVAWYGGPPFK